jgi:ketosteroid isomerase-like protein
MKPLAFLAALILVGLPAARGQDAARGGDPRQDLKSLEHAWSDAIVKRDTTAIDRILADDYVLTTPEGRLVTKAQILQTFRSPGDPSFVIQGVDLAEMTIRVFGETALVSCRFTLKVQSEGRKVETPFRHTDVFVKRPVGWRCESRQATRIRQSYGHDPSGDDES